MSRRDGRAHRPNSRALNALKAVAVTSSPSRRQQSYPFKMSANLIFFFFSFACECHAAIDRLAPTRSTDGLGRATVLANIRRPRRGGRQRGTFDRRRKAISEELGLSDSRSAVSTWISD